MTLTQLSYILAVGEHRHFGTAAEKCFVTQPTLSMQIKKLEDELEVEIFDRSKNPTEPTALGQLILDQARIVAAESDRIMEIVHRTQDKVEGAIRLGIIPTLAPSLLPLFIKDFTQQYPKLEVSIEEIQTHQIVARLKDGSLDLGLLVTPLKDPALTEQALFQEPFLIYCSDNHPFMKMKQVDQKQLSSQDVWLLNEGHCFRDQVINLCADRKKGSGVSANLKFESGNLETLKKMVDQGDGYTLLPSLLTTDIKDSDQKKRLKHFSSPIPTREVSLIHHKTYPKRAIVKALTEILQKHLPKEITQLRAGSFKRIGLSSTLR